MAKPNLFPFIPIHSLDDVRQWIDQNPTLLTKPRDNGRYLLHYACWKSTSVEVIDFILKQNPSVIHLRDDNNSLPIHFLAQRGFTDAIQILIRALTPDEIQNQLSEVNTWDITPLLYAIRSGVRESIELLFELCPSMIQRSAAVTPETTILSERMPIMALMNSNLSSDFILSILRRTYDLFGFDWIPTNEVWDVLIVGLGSDLRTIFDFMIDAHPDWLDLELFNCRLIFQRVIVGYSPNAIRHLVETGIKYKGSPWLHQVLAHRSFANVSVLMCAVESLSADFEYVLMLVNNALSDPTLDPEVRAKIIDGIVGRCISGNNLLHYAFRASAIPLLLQTINLYGGSAAVWSALNAEGAEGMEGVEGVKDDLITWLLKFHYKANIVRAVVRFGIPWRIPMECVVRFRGTRQWRKCVLALDPTINMCLDGDNRYQYEIKPEQIHSIRQKMYFNHSLTSLLVYFC